MSNAAFVTILFVMLAIGMWAQMHGAALEKEMKQ